jgi:hypothetical protein
MREGGRERGRESERAREEAGREREREGMELPAGGREGGRGKKGGREGEGRREGGRERCNSLNIHRCSYSTAAVIRPLLSFDRCCYSTAAVIRPLLEFQTFSLNEERAAWPGWSHIRYRELPGWSYIRPCIGGAAWVEPYKAMYRGAAWVELPPMSSTPMDACGACPSVPAQRIKTRDKRPLLHLHTRPFIHNSVILHSLRSAFKRVH